MSDGKEGAGNSATGVGESSSRIAFGELQAKKFVVIRFPGIVENVDAAIECLGGLKRLSMDHFHCNSLQVAYQRQQNPYSRSVPSRKAKANYVLLRVRRPKNDPPQQEGHGDNGQPNGADPKLQDLQIIGATSNVTTYEFSSPFDFQFLPMGGSATTGFSSILDSLIPKDVDTAVHWFDKDHDRGQQAKPDPDLFLIPHGFTRYFTATPYPFVLCREPERAPAMQVLAQKEKVGIRLRPDRKIANLIFSGSGPFPEQASADLIREIDTKYPSPDVHRLMEQAFNERPLSLKLRLMAKTKIEEHTLKMLLIKYAFYISNGPWGRLWCRYGYDPRKNKEAAKYQVVSLHINNIRKAVRVQAIRTGSSAPPVSTEKAKTEVENRPEGEEELAYAYIPGRIPPLRQTSYQLADIHLKQVQDALQRYVDHSRTEADALNGWFQTGAIDTIRDMLKDDVMKTFQTMVDNQEAW